MSEGLHHIVELMRRECATCNRSRATSNISFASWSMQHPMRRPAGLVARYALVSVLARMERHGIADVARQHFPRDTDLSGLIEVKTAIGPAQTTVTGWAAELVGTTVQDIADRLLPQTALAQLRPHGLAYAFLGGGLVSVPYHTPTPSGAFVRVADAVPVAQLLLASLGLKPKKAAAITAATRELITGSTANVERSLRVILAEDTGLMIDGILLGSGAATAAAPAGLLNGMTSRADRRWRYQCHAWRREAAIRRHRARACSGADREYRTGCNDRGAGPPGPGRALIVAPYLAASTVIAVAAAAFASALGVPDFSTADAALVNMDTDLIRDPSALRARRTPSASPTARCGRPRASASEP
jgi:hypothetical protein